jgi:DNA-binding protein HU-beta
MNKAELAQALAKKIDLSVAKTSEIIFHTFGIISKALAKNDSVQLIGFGSFSVKKRKAREGRNPQTGETIKIPARKVISFSVGKALKLEINNK